jgi:hypothetical protein
MGVSWVCGLKFEVRGLGRSCLVNNFDDKFSRYLKKKTRQLAWSSFGNDDLLVG